MSGGFEKVKRGWWQRVCERFKTARTPPHERPGQTGFSSTAAHSIDVCDQAWREGSIANWGDINPYRPDSIEHSHWENGFADPKGERA